MNDQPSTAYLLAEAGGALEGSDRERWEEIQVHCGNQAECLARYVNTGDPAERAQLRDRALALTAQSRALFLCLSPAARDLFARTISR